MKSVTMILAMIAIAVSGCAGSGKQAKVDRAYEIQDEFNRCVAGLAISDTTRYNACVRQSNAAYRRADIQPSDLVP